MFASAARLSLRTAASASASMASRAAAPAAARMLVAPSTQMQLPAFAAISRRTYASGGGLSQQDIQSRIVEVLKSFEKVDPAKVGALAVSFHC
jgi:NADH dehydrogenase (ubiquinone) 1 alpha/beta subcomplex 1, acyl-carrier protein